MLQIFLDPALYQKSVPVDARHLGTVFKHDRDMSYLADFLISFCIEAVCVNSDGLYVFIFRLVRIITLTQVFIRLYLHDSAR